jgi:REP element-mobilizing transposase RayT
MLNKAGDMIQMAWGELPVYYCGFNVEAFQVMPNHIHGIIRITDFNEADFKRLSLSEVIRRFKTLTTKKYIDGVKQDKWNSFYGKLWQRNYYEHIIRDEHDYRNILEYIFNNPFQWQKDEYYNNHE